MEVNCVVGPVVREVADASAAEASGAACRDGDGHCFDQLVREQGAAAGCCRVGLQKTAMTRGDLDEWICCKGGGIMQLAWLFVLRDL